jgi:two-component system, cell cycle response regulator DivK
VGQKILVVEDNELNLKLFCDLLRAHGYEAEPVRDGREALDRARAFAPDLVVMDIQMPYVSGLELIEQMKADSELKATPIMAVTAYAAKGDEERIRDAGAEGYVSKPISVARFVEAVAGLLAAAEAAGEAVEAPVEPEETLEPEETEGTAETAEGSEPDEAGEEAETVESALPNSSDAADQPAALAADRPSHQSGNVDEGGEGKVDPGIRRDDAGPNGATP